MNECNTFKLKNFDLLNAAWFNMTETETGFTRVLIIVQLNKKNPAIK